MGEQIENSQNLSAHYSANAKVVRHPHVVVNAPKKMPVLHVYNDIDANNKISKINTDIYEKTQDEKGSANKKFWKGYLAFVAAILAFLGIRRFFK